MNSTTRPGSPASFPQPEDRARGLYGSFAEAPIGLVCVDLENRIRWGNRKFRQMSGYSEEELTRKELQDLLHPDELPTTKAIRKKFLAGEFQQRAIEHRLLRKNGDILWTNAHISLINDEAGQPECFVAIIVDITEQKQAEKALRLSEERFASAFEFAPIGMALVSPDGHWLRVNKALCEILGYRSNELFGKTFQQITHPDDLQADLELVRKLLANKLSSYQMEKRYFHKDGHIVWAQLSVSLARDTARNPLYFISQVQDITERKEALEQIGAQAALLDLARDAILVRDLEGRILFWNKGAERIYGWTKQEALGQKAFDLLGMEPTSYEQSIAAVTARGEWFGEVEEVTKDKRKLTIEARMTLLSDPKGKPKSILSIKTDISEKKRIEAQFLRSQRMESIGTLASGIAHDLNNLLSPMIIGVDLLKMFGLPARSEKVVVDMEASIKRGADLVQQILTFARGVEGARVSVHMREVIREIASIVTNTFPKNITIETKVASDLWLIHADPTQLHQVLLNLSVNARDAMPQGGTLTFAAFNHRQNEIYASMYRGRMPSGPCVVIEITDTGVGIPQDNIDKIFDPFFTTKELGKGTGLGLASVLGIVRNHDGSIYVESQPGRGTTFAIYFPAVPESANPTPVIVDGDLPRGQGETLLLVDDEARLLGIMRQSLEAHGYQVLTAENGEDAIKVYRENRDKIALVITDMMMPIMDGPATIEALKKINPDLRMAATSGLAGDTRVLQARTLGVTHFLPKPCTSHTLLHFIHTVLK